MENSSRIAAILPRGKLFDRVFAEGIARTKKKLGPGEFFRINPDLSTESKLRAHFDAIQSAATIIADVTARSANVMYLAGYARALKKDLTLIAQHAEDFPFDLSASPPIIYGSDLAFLREELIASFSARTGAPSTLDDPRTKFLSHFGDLLEKHGHQHRGSILLEQPNTYTLLEQDMDLLLVQDIARRGRELGIRVKLM